MTQDISYKIPKITQEDPALGAGSVHLWQIPLDPPEGFHLLDLLSGSERDRAQRFHHEIHRARFIAAHAALRCILAHYLDCSSAEVTFDLNDHGKPEVLGLRFNLSHSHDLALVILSQDQRVGIDLEFIDAAGSFADDAMAYLSQAEREALRALPPIERERAFCHLWVRKEALLKALGTGITHGLDRFSVNWWKSEARLLWIDPALTHGNWTLTGISLPGFAAAMAVEHGPFTTVSHHWTWA